MEDGRASGHSVPTPSEADEASAWVDRKMRPTYVWIEGETPRYYRRRMFCRLVVVVGGILVGAIGGILQPLGVGDKFLSATSAILGVVIAVAGAFLAEFRLTEKWLAFSEARDALKFKMDEARIRLRDALATDVTLAAEAAADQRAGLLHNTPTLRAEKVRLLGEYRAILVSMREKSGGSQVGQGTLPEGK